VEEENNYIKSFVATPVRRRGEPNGSFFGDLFRYLILRVVQVIRILSVLLSLSLDSGSNMKGMVVRRMYWGRTSFYRTAFQVIVLFVTIAALVASIGTRTDIFAQEQTGVMASSGIIGNNDIFLQVGTTEAITEAQVSDVDYTIEKYTVKAGDTLAGIAHTYGVSEDTIRWANRIPAGRDTLRVGQELDIPPMNGVLYVVAQGDTLDSIIKKVKDANRFDLIELNNLQAPGYTLTVGQKLFIPDATYNPPVVVAKAISGSAPGGTYVNTGGQGVSVPSGTFVNPMQQCGGYTFIRGWRYSHTGVDLAHPSGCWIVAAGAGTVLKAGWCSGSMGFCVIIRHDNGYSTLYMHGQGQFAVRSGQRVNAGQRIMTLGNTGKSYGAHLHLSLSPPGVDVGSSYYGRINPAGIIPY